MKNITNFFILFFMVIFLSGCTNNIKLENNIINKNTQEKYSNIDKAYVESRLENEINNYLYDDNACNFSKIYFGLKLSEEFNIRNLIKINYDYQKINKKFNNFLSYNCGSLKYDDVIYSLESLKLMDKLKIDINEINKGIDNEMYSYDNSTNTNGFVNLYNNQAIEYTYNIIKVLDKFNLLNNNIKIDRLDSYINESLNNGDFKSVIEGLWIEEKLGLYNSLSVKQSDFDRIINSIKFDSFNNNPIKYAKDFASTYNFKINIDINKIQKGVNEDIKNYHSSSLSDNLYLAKEWNVLNMIKIDDKSKLVDIIKNNKDDFLNIINTLKEYNILDEKYINDISIDKNILADSFNSNLNGCYNIDYDNYLDNEYNDLIDTLKEYDITLNIKNMSNVISSCISQGDFESSYAWINIAKNFSNINYLEINLKNSIKNND